ncbi:hypothetical protein [Paraburkholderia sp.]|uniref:hypothetical protein n=1 Tax=Paraburkholderia sp. TaxID=1926495 RepID=UPI003D6FA6D7
MQVSLIGDPNQGIYEFAGANGKFLAQYGERIGVTDLGMTRNYRSVPPIVDLANKLSTRNDVADRKAPETTHGAFFIPYKTTDRDKVVTAFQAAVLAAELKVERSAVLCRGRDLADKLAGNDSPAGQGTVKGFAQAAIARDKKQDYMGAFKGAATCIAGLLADPPKGLVASITQPTRYPEAHSLRRLIWRFTRNPDTGLPSATLLADTEWHPQLLVRVKTLLATLQSDHGLKTTDNLGMRLAKKSLPNAPLVAAADLAAPSTARIRVDTVHQAKGESLDAVLYMATKEHVSALLSGIDSEVGRIGYVAVTRARNLLWLGVPANALNELRPKLIAFGFHEAGSRVPSGSRSCSIKAVHIPMVETTSKWLGSSAPREIHLGIATSIVQLAAFSFACKDLSNSDEFSETETATKFVAALMSLTGTIVEAMCGTVAKSATHPLSAFIMKAWNLGEESAESWARAGRIFGAAGGAVAAFYDLAFNLPEALHDKNKLLAGLYFTSGALGLYIAIATAFFPAAVLFWPAIVASFVIALAIAIVNSSAMHNWISRCYFGTGEHYEDINAELKAYNKAAGV